MKRLRSLFIASAPELIVVLVLALCSSLFGIPGSRINADGEGYYEYLPSVFIRHDLLRKDYTPDQLQHFKETAGYTYVPAGNGLAQKYNCGVAILISPFFLSTLPFVDSSDDGYSALFQGVVFVAALFYLFIGLIAFRLLLSTYAVTGRVVTWIQVALALATSVFFYTAYESTFSHVFGFTLVTLFMYFSRRFFSAPSKKYFYLLCLIFGFIFLVRPVNIVLLGMLPFLAGSWPAFIGGLRSLFSFRVHLLAGLLIPCLIFSVQCVLWKLQCDKWFVDTYPTEKFDFTNPHVTEMLFGFRKGVFVYAPVLLLCLAGIIVMARTKKIYELFTGTGFLFVLAYILSSWHDWGYGGSFGSRVFVDYYPLLGVFIGTGLFAMSRWLFAASRVYIVACCSLCLLQVWQYNHFYLHWAEMDAARYWRVFLRTDKMYAGLVWKPLVYREWNQVDQETGTAEPIGAWGCDTLYEHYFPSSHFEKPSLVLAGIDAEFSDRIRGFVEVSVCDSATGAIWVSKTGLVFHFSEFDGTDHGFYPFDIPAHPGGGTQKIMVRHFADHTPGAIRTFDIQYMDWKE